MLNWHLGKYLGGWGKFPGEGIFMGEFSGGVSRSPFRITSVFV